MVEPKKNTALYDELRGTQRKAELEAWHHWNNSGRKPEHLEPLIRSIQPLITAEAKKRLPGLGGAIPAVALKQELRNAAMRAIETYDPNHLGPTGKPSQLSTHITTNFQRVTDFVSTMRNPKNNPRALFNRYGQYQNAVNEFTEEHGRDPSVDEVKVLLPGFNPREIKQIRRGFGNEVFSDFGTEIKGDVASSGTVQKIRNAATLLQSRLSAEEQQFIDLHYPSAGRQASVEAVAKKMGLPRHRVYRLKKAIENKLAPLVRSE